MAIYVNDLILNALKTVRLYTEFQPVQPKYVTDSLNLLNELISTLNQDDVSIPYQSNLTFFLEGGKSNYRIAPTGIVDVIHQPFSAVNYIDLYWNQIQYPIAIINDLNELNIFKNTNIQAIPSSARVHQVIAEDTNNRATDIIFTNPPDIDYECRIRGKALLVKAELETDITGLPEYYSRFFRLWIAREITQYYPTNGWTPELSQELMLAENFIRSSADLDLWVRTDNLLGKRDPYIFNTYLGVRS
jgi:hypothetical protein